MYKNTRVILLYRFVLFTGIPPGGVDFNAYLDQSTSVFDQTQRTHGYAWEV